MKNPKKNRQNLKQNLKQSDIVKYDKCDKSMSYKNFRYSHNCDPKPVEKQANPKTQNQRQNPKLFQNLLLKYITAVAMMTLIKKKQQKQQQNPLLDITNSYALLQQQLMQQRQDKYNKVCAGMFGPRTKKR